MSETYNQLGLKNALPSTPLEHVAEVHLAMEEARAALPEAGLSQFNSFAHVYSEVTNDVHENIDSFRVHDALHIAAGRFSDHYFKQHRAYLDDKPEDIEPHWNVFFSDKRAKKVDDGTLLLMGMAAHISGDLGRSVFEANAPEEYIKHDYPRVNGLLWERAFKESKRYVPAPMGSERVRKGLTKLVMSGIVYGREVALGDFERMKRAESEEELQEIVTETHLRTEKIVKGILTAGYILNKVVRVQPTTGTADPKELVA